MGHALPHGRARPRDVEARPVSDPLRLCRVDDLPDPGARSFAFGEGTARRDVVVVRAGGHIFAYDNACPHQGTPLETFPDRFLTPEGKLIVCSTHGARFRLDDGLCVSGPCKGERLKALRILLDDGWVALADAPAP